MENYTAMNVSEVSHFAEIALPFLKKKEDEHNLLISLTSLLLGPNVEIGEPVLRLIYRGTEVIGAALRTGDNRALICSEMPRGAVAPLWQSVADLDVPIKELNGPDHIVDLLAAESKLPFNIFMYLGAYRLTKVNEPLYKSAGCLRLATSADLDLLEQWVKEFRRDAMIGDFPPAREFAQKLVNSSSYYLWEVAGKPVCKTHSTQPMRSSIKITGVYTPTHLRGKGYASHCVAGISKELLNQGYKKVLLYTDLLNPTSNSIYQKIGYQKFASLKHLKL